MHNNEDSNVTPSVVASVASDGPEEITEEQVAEARAFAERILSGIKGMIAAEEMSVGIEKVVLDTRLRAHIPHAHNGSHVTALTSGTDALFTPGMRQAWDLIDRATDDIDVLREGIAVDLSLRDAAVLLTVVVDTIMRHAREDHPDMNWWQCTTSAKALALTCGLFAEIVSKSVGWTDDFDDPSGAPKPA